MLYLVWVYSIGQVSPITTRKAGYQSLEVGFKALGQRMLGWGMLGGDLTGLGFRV